MNTDKDSDRSELPREFLNRLAKLKHSYLAESDPIRQSGFAGGFERWKSERSPILEAIDHDGEVLDVGCANGYLVQCLVEWAKDDGKSLTPYGVDQGTGLIKLARTRFPGMASHFYVANAWNWRPPQLYQYVYTLYDCVPEEFLSEYLRQLLSWAVKPGGRLIIGAYGSRSDQIPPFGIATFLEYHGYELAGSTYGGNPPVTAFAWVDRER